MLLGPLPSVCVERIFHLPPQQATYFLQFHLVSFRKLKGVGVAPKSANFEIPLRTTTTVDAFTKALVLENYSTPQRKLCFSCLQKCGHREKIEAIVKTNLNSEKTEISINRPPN